MTKEKKHPWGRPPFYKTKEELQEAIDKYFKETPEMEITITWLALHLGFSERKSLIDYQWKEEFVHAIKNAKLKVENSYEKSLRVNGRTWDIFALKNFDWKDKSEVDNTNTNIDVSEELNEEQRKKIANRFK